MVCEQAIEGENVRGKRTQGLQRTVSEAIPAVYPAGHLVLVAWSHKLRRDRFSTTGVEGAAETREATVEARATVEREENFILWTGSEKRC
jgi:hypothetical protein